MRSFVLTLAALGLLAACPGPGGGLIPSADTCGEPGVAALTGLEVSIGEGDFAATPPDAIVTLARGGQGGLMLPLRVRGLGTAPECLGMSITLRVGKETVAFSDTPLRTYADGAARTTKVFYLVLYGWARAGDRLGLEVAAGGQTFTRSYFYAQRGDGGP